LAFIQLKMLLLHRHESVARAPSLSFVNVVEESFILLQGKIFKVL